MAGVNNLIREAGIETFLREYDWSPALPRLLHLKTRLIG